MKWSDNPPQATAGVARLLEELGATRDLTHVLRDQGYWILRPRSVAETDPNAWLRRRSNASLARLDLWITPRRDERSAQ
jgi:hypothetical protein